VIVAALSAELLPRCVRLLETRVLRVCGRWSFAMYLLHEPLIVVVYVLSLRHGWPLLLGSELPIQLLFTTVCIGATVAVAAVSWRFYEQPILRLKRFFPMGQERKKTASVTVPAEDVSAAA
jgi:peptidoglycan/LPS O-acetylase OafA/YrhL